MHYLKPATTATPRGTPTSLQRKQNVQFRNTFGHLCAYVGRCVVIFLLTQAGDHYMHNGDGDGIVPDPPPHHRGKQKATAKVGELQGQEVH